MADLRTQDSTQSFETTDVLSLWKDLERISKEAILKVDGVLSTKEIPVQFPNEHVFANTVRAIRLDCMSSVNRL